MRRAGVEAGPRLYNVLMTHRGLVNDLDGIRRVERQMRISGVRPNSATHGARVAAYARCGELVLAERALERYASGLSKIRRHNVYGPSLSALTVRLKTDTSFHSYQRSERPAAVRAANGPGLHGAGPGACEEGERWGVPPVAERNE